MKKGNIKALYQAGETTVTVSLEGANSATFTVKVIDDSEGVLILDNDTLDKLFELNLVDTDSEHKSELTKLHFPGAFTYTDGKKYKIINISSGMFANCASLESIEIPNSITTIESNSFGNTPIKEVTIPDSVINLEYAFVGCTSLEKIIIGNGLTEIKDGQFPSLSSLKTVIIGNGVTKIGNSAFNGCRNLEKVTIGNSVETIGFTAFKDTKIEKITIPNNVTSLGIQVFKDCKSLATVTIGNGVTEINSGAFSGCSLLKLKLPDQVATIGNNAFSGILCICYTKDLKAIATNPAPDDHWGAQTYEVIP